MRNLVGVYGTLRRGECNHDVISKAGGRYLGYATIDGVVVYDTKPFPVAKLTNDKSKTIVEVFEVDDWCFDDIDRLEGYNPKNQNEGLFDRVQFSTMYGDVWVYIYNPVIGDYMGG